jgi:hypothetical protein
MTEQRGKAPGRMESLRSLLRKGAQTAASIERIAAVSGRLRLPVQLSARALLARHDRSLLAGARSQERVGGVGSESPVDSGREHTGIARLIQRVAATAKAMRATARATDSISNKATGKLPVAMEALARTERSVAAGNVASAIVTAPRGSIVAPMKNSQLSRRMAAGLETGRAMSTGTRAIVAARAASSIHGVVPPSKLSQRMFAEPSSGNRGRDNRSGGAGITINSSPTVVINGPAEGGIAQRDVLGALRAHREELFDQLKRESARGERAQF